jgi:hypothetical protein
MVEAVITFVKTVTFPNPETTYAVTEVMRVEFDDEEGFRNLVEDLRTDGAKMRSRYDIVNIETLKAEQ